MTLNDWSLVYFAATAFYLFVFYITIFRAQRLYKFILMIFAWALHLGVTLTYGIATGQIGFVFVFGLEVALALVMFTMTGKMVKANAHQ